MHYLYGFHVNMNTNHKSLQYVFTKKELNPKQQRLLKLLKDYDMSVFCHPGKTNVVADDLCRINMGSVSHVEEVKKDLMKDNHRFARLGVRLENSTNYCFVVHHNIESSLLVEVNSKKHVDPLLMELKE